MPRRSERGATLVHVAFLLAGTILFSGFVVDYGTYWVSRRQAQNAADAGALSGALARIHDDSSPNPSTTSGLVYNSVVNTVGLNPIWGVAPAPANVQMGWTCPDGSSNCVWVDVFRDGTNGSTATPTFFLKMVNVQSQKVRAHAVAEIYPANGTGCLRPWFIPNTFADGNGNGVYDAEDIGTPVTFHNNVTPSGYGQLDVGAGGSDIREAIRECYDGAASFEVGDTVPTKPGGTVGPEKQGIDSLMAWDPGANYMVYGSGNNKTVTITGSCAGVPTACDCSPYICPYNGTQSPRIVDVPVCDPIQADCNAAGPNSGSIIITDILSFFITDPPYSGNGNDLIINAVLIGHAGTRDPGATGVSSFLNVVVLVR